MRLTLSSTGPWCAGELVTGGVRFGVKKALLFSFCLTVVPSCEWTFQVFSHAGMAPHIWKRHQGSEINS